MTVDDVVQRTLEQRVLSAADNGFPETLDFLRKLVRQPSTLGHERGAQELVHGRLKGLGLDSQMWDIDETALRSHPSYTRLGPGYEVGYAGRPNVTAVWRGESPGGRSVILNGHIDVVSPEPVGKWSHGPWDADVDGDWMYGRGAGDMKAGIAAMILAVQAVREAGFTLRGDVILQSVIEEE